MDRMFTNAPREQNSILVRVLPTIQEMVLHGSLLKHFFSIIRYVFGGAHGVMVIVAGSGHGDTSSNPGRDSLRFT